MTLVDSNVIIGRKKAINP